MLRYKSILKKEGNDMKKLEIIIKSENLDDLKKLLTGCNDNSIMISKIMDYNNQNRYKKIGRGIEYYVDLIRKIKIETILDSETAKIIIDKVLNEISNGNYKEGKIFISEIENVVKLYGAEN